MLKHIKNEFKLIDKTVFYVSLVSLLLLSVPIIIFPQQSERVVAVLNSFVINSLGSSYIWYGLFCMVFCLWISFSRFGQIKLGEEDEKPQFSTFSWSAMLFSAGVGAGVVYWGIIEWVYYYTSPPLGAEVGSWQAAELSAAYGLFHWGPMAWAIYTVIACSIGYLLYVRKSTVLKASEASRGLFGDKVDGILGKLMDIFFIFGIVGAVATSLGLGSPLITASISYVLNIPVTSTVEVMVLLLITAIFAVSAYSGLEKGIKRLSDINTWLAIVLIGFVFIVGNPKFVVDMTTTALGLMIAKFPTMATWLDPAGKSMFPQNWTVFYWAWWGGYAPFMGMFFARISKGRTIKQMVMGALFFGSLGCFLFFGVLGNYGLSLQLNGTLDVVNSLSTIGAPLTIIAIMETLPFPKLVIGVLGVLCIIFAATSYDSASYIIAANTQTRVEDGEPKRWLRVLWAFGLALIPTGFLLLEAPLSTLQTATLVLSVPVAFIVITSAFSFVKMVKNDIKSGKLTQSCVLREFPELVTNKEVINEGNKKLHNEQ